MKKQKNKIANKIYSKRMINSIQKKLDLLGYKNTFEATEFLNIRFLSSIFIFFMLLYITEWGYIIAPVVTCIYFIVLPSIMIDSKIKKRREELDGDAMYFFEVLTLSLESGKSLKRALEITAQNIDSELSMEFRKTLEEVDLGKSLNESLENLKKRIPSDTINNIILNAQQSNIFGNSIIETMYNQIDYIRDKRIMETKAKISKIPTKVSVISVVFFIPLIMLLILSPVIIDFIGG